MAARSGAVNHENIFVAKIPDSESARRRFRASGRLAVFVEFNRARFAKIRETAAAQGFPAILTNADVGRSGVSYIAVATYRIVVAGCAARAAASLRQHFLKWDAVFFDVLVYSG